MKRIKKQDIPVVASILCEAYIRNKADFVNFSSVFDGTYEADMQTAIQAVKDRRRPADALDKQKMVTIKVYEKLDDMQEVLRLLGEYIKMAGDTLLTDYEFYHIKKARVALRLKNVEGVLEHCEQIIDKIVQDDAAALAVVGFDAGKLAELEALHLELDTLNKEQVHKVNERQDLKEIEDALFEAMYEYIDRISSVGKAMYTYKKKQKYSDFSVNKILGQINHGRKKKVEDDGSETETAAVYDVMIGRVTDKATDDALEDVVVRIERTSIMADTDSDGEFYIDVLLVFILLVSRRGVMGGWSSIM